MSTRFRSFLSKHGITHQHSCAHTPEQNGMPKRKHHHGVETSFTLLSHSQMSLAYWLEAFNASVFLVNRMPTKALFDVSPWEVLFQKSPNYSFLRVFDCACYPWLRPYTCNKMKFRSIKCVFIGYNLNHKGYCCLDPITGRVYLSHVTISSTPITGRVYLSRVTISSTPT